MKIVKEQFECPIELEEGRVAVLILEKQEKEEKHSILYDNVAIPEVHIHKKEK